MFAINQNYDSIDGELIRKARKSLFEPYVKVIF